MKKIICNFFLAIVDFYSHLRYGKSINQNQDGVKFIDNIIKDRNLPKFFKSIIYKEITERKKIYKNLEGENIFSFRFEDYPKISNWLKIFIKENNAIFSKLANEVSGNICEFSKADILVNFGVEKKIEKHLSGSALYHRDGDSIVRYAKIFIPIFFDNCENSETCFISKKDVPDYIYFVPKIIRKKFSNWNKTRIEEDQIISFCKKPIDRVAQKITLDKIAAFDCTRIYHAGGYINNPNGVRVIIQLSYATKSPANFNNNFNKLDLFLLSTFQKVLKFLQVKIYS
jgi:hypothetical protein